MPVRPPLAPVVCAVLLLTSTFSAARAQAGIGLGDTPAYSFTDLQGNALTQNEFKDSVLLLYFWASWSELSTNNLPHLTAIHEAYQSQNLQVLGIALDPEGQDNTLRQFVQQHNVPWTVGYSGLGWDDPMSIQFRVEGIPQAYILSPRGQLLWSGHPVQITNELMDQIYEAVTPPEDVPIREDRSLISEQGDFGGSNSFYENGKYRNAYTLRLNEGDRVEINLSSNELDTYLILEHPDGMTQEDDDGGGGTNSRISFTAPRSGAYTVYATTYNEDQIGRFRIEAIQRPADD